MKKDFKDWMEMQIYLAARDWASIRLGVLKEVYEKLVGSVNVEEITKKIDNRFYKQ